MLKANAFYEAEQYEKLTHLLKKAEKKKRNQWKSWIDGMSLFALCNESN